jgi:ATP-dependent RNA helicase DHX57
MFCTTGILLRRLMSDHTLDGVTHVIVDEVHERTVENDFLLILLRKLVKQRDIRVVLMSATFNAALFSEYFEGAQVINIPGRMFPVQQHLLEDVLEQLKPKLYHERELNDAEQEEFEECRRLFPKFSEQTQRNLFSLKAHTSSPQTINVDLIASLIRSIDEHSEEGAILVFFPGLEEILALYDRLKSSSLHVMPLHGSLSSEAQQDVFKAPPKGKRKVVLSTNIAETSITIDDVVFVIDSGKMNEIQYDSQNSMSRLAESWVSRANARQRQGRAGRVKPGHYYALYSSATAQNLPQHQTAEISRVPLHQLCLQIKLLGIPSIAAFLSHAIEPPEADSLRAAIQSCVDLGALSEREELTPLGYHLATIPTDVRIGKVLLFGTLLRCIDPILTIAACLSSKSPFVAPLQQRDEANEARQRFATSKSDHLTVYKAYEQWSKISGRAEKRSFCSENFLSETTLRALDDLKRQFAEILTDMGFLPRGQLRGGRFGGELFNVNSGKYSIIKAALLGGLAPNIIKCVAPKVKYVKVIAGATQQDAEAREWKFKLKGGERVFLHPRSINFRENVFDPPFLAYYEKVQTSKVFVRDSSVPPIYALLLFGGKITVKHEAGLLVLDGWLELRAPARIGVLVKEVRQALDALLAMKIEDPSLDISANPLLELVVALIARDGLISEVDEVQGH